MKAKLTIDQVVEAAFPRETMEESFNRRSFTQVVSYITARMLDKVQERPHSDRIILAGYQNDGFVELDTIKLEGIIPYIEGTLYNYGINNSNLQTVAGRYNGDHMLVAAVNQEIADKCEGTLKDLGYDIERV